MDPMAERIARQICEHEERAASLREALPKIARRLRSEGARRIILFGSLASGAPPHAGTDIDLCVEGLSQKTVERLALEFSESVGRVDLVRWETAPADLRAVIECYGKPVLEEA